MVVPRRDLGDRRSFRGHRFRRDPVGHAGFESQSWQPRSPRALLRAEVIVNTLRVGIVSANWGAFAHLPAWRSLPGVEVVGICTSRQETAAAAAKKFGIERAFCDAEARAADPDIDILDCGTRPSIRFAMVLAALRHKKHVYNSIPFAADVDHARSLHRAWKSSGLTAIVDAFSEWIPAHRAAKQMLQDGYIGQPFGGTCKFNISLFNKPH